MVETINQGTVTILGLGIILGLIGWVIWLKYKNPDMTVGEVINVLVLHEKVSIFIFMNILVNIASALVASSIHPKGEAAVNVLARMSVHGAVSLVAIVCNIIAPVLLILTMEEFSAQNKKDKADRNYGRPIMMLFLTFVLGLGSVFFPMLNVFIIAGGLQEVDKLVCLWQYCNGYGGLVAFEQMSYIMQAEVGAMMAHYFLAGIDSLWITISPHAATQEAIRRSVVEAAKSKGGSDGKSKSSSKSSDKTVKKNKEKKDEDDLKNLENGIRYLLVRRGYAGKDLQKKQKQAEKVLDSMSPADQNKVANAVAKLYSEIDTWDNSDIKKNSTDEERKEKNQLFEKRIYSLFEGSTADGSGFGFQLKLKNHEKN